MVMGAVKMVVEVLMAETTAVVLMVRWRGGDGDTGKGRVFTLASSSRAQQQTAAMAFPLSLLT